MSDGSAYERELEVAREAAAEAAALLQGRAGADQVRLKGRADLVTEVDEAAERAIVARIQRDFPADTIVAEEFSASALGSGRTWVIDPLDGTINYVHAHPFTCVSIAFVDEMGPAAGVIHAPFLDEIYEARRGAGAFLNGKRIRVSPVTEAGSALFSTGFPFKPGKGQPEPYFRLVTELLLASQGVRRDGAAALDLAFVASGRFEGFFEIGLAPWDIAAGILLVQEAGGTVSGWPEDEGSPLRTGRIIASNGALHPWLTEVIARFADQI